ncbi:hypothetical protein Lesp02_17140 [Lentzea sp. NBRC 105346]|uniref:DUF4352 domain-containing protein n=1 Tax=Lentzea sp. NBRC 105346 TaxID=3032205 RepID=UPI0024A5360D|nr:DUF4352 domain-containing protein [Lentzea sp. NBRC 105346]GLZ29524.1 hypothetical protein Lesp02_17140 [Lentzea sp. NBRC 105346]
MRALVLLLLLAACSVEPAAAPPAPSSTYPVPAETARPDEVILHLPPVNDGDTVFTPLGLSTGMPTLIGSHAEMAARGQFVRIRVIVVNNGRSSALFDARKQVLVDASAKEYLPDEPAMTVKRQPAQTDLGAGVRLEFDLYYDIPTDAKPLKLRVYGGPTLTDLKDEKGTDLPLNN